jgi:hypothetical protein
VGWTRYVAVGDSTAEGARRLRGVSSGDGRVPKRPGLFPVVVPTPRSHTP